MTNSNLEEKITAAVTSRTPGARDPRIISVQNRFLDGSLYTVAFEMENPQGEVTSHVNRVYIHGKTVDVFGFDDQLLAIVGATHGRGIAECLKSAQFVTSIIAIAITLLICAHQGLALYTGNSPEVPEFLSSGFLLILGFYFGKTFHSKD